MRKGISDSRVLERGLERTSGSRPCTRWAWGIGHRYCTDRASLHPSMPSCLAPPSSGAASQRFHGEKELFRSEHVDWVAANTITDICSVHTLKAYQVCATGVNMKANSRSCTVQQQNSKFRWRNPMFGGWRMNGLIPTSPLCALIRALFALSLRFFAKLTAPVLTLRFRSFHVGPFPSTHEVGAVGL